MKFDLLNITGISMLYCRVENDKEAFWLKWAYMVAILKLFTGVKSVRNVK